MSKQVYISADYDATNGDTDVVDELHRWAEDNEHLVDFVDMAEVVSGSVSKNSDCRICDLKAEFNSQIYYSSACIFVVGDMTKYRNAGSTCKRHGGGYPCDCTPYKQNTNGTRTCKHPITYSSKSDGDIGIINTYSYLEHEFRQAVRRNKTIIIVYNSMRKESSWMPDYMSGYESVAEPFWITNGRGNRVGDYDFIKQALGYE